jgi:hypothetical protein
VDGGYNMNAEEFYDISYSKIQVDKRFMNARRIVHFKFPNGDYSILNIVSCWECPYYLEKESRMLHLPYGECGISNNKFPREYDENGEDKYIDMGIPCNCPLPLTKLLWSFGVDKSKFNWYFGSDSYFLIESNPYFYFNTDEDFKQKLMGHSKYGSKSNLRSVLRELRYSVKIVKSK